MWINFNFLTVAPPVNLADDEEEDDDDAGAEIELGDEDRWLINLVHFDIKSKFL